MPDASPPPPVAIGGLGGSGTRVFASTLQYAGLHIGESLNAPLDNLWFTVLFKRATWAYRETLSPEEVTPAVKLFVRAMTQGLRGGTTPEETALLDHLRAPLLPQGAWRNGATASDANALCNSTPPPGGPSRRWGWKEPNTHVFLPHLDRLIPGLRYIHVVRDGLDMAFSRNTWQARHWSPLFGVPLNPGAPLPLHQLRYWVAANRRALDYGQQHMPGRFLAISYEDFCARPLPYWQILCRFLNLPEDTPPPEDLISPSTIGRSAKHDLSDFPEELIATARAITAEVVAAALP